MMFEPERNIDRAYVEAHEPADAAQLAALRWAVQRSGGDYSQVNLRLPNTRLRGEYPALSAAERRGVKVSADRAGTGAAVVPGPMVVLHPTLESLMTIEDNHTVTAIIVLVASDQLQPWIDAFTPEHVGGHLLEPLRPAVQDPVVEQAIGTFTAMINSSTGLSHPSDKAVVIDGLKQLRAAGHALIPDELMASALQHNWRGSAALELRHVALDLNRGVNKRHCRTGLRPDMVTVWREDAGL